MIRSALAAFVATVFLAASGIAHAAPPQTNLVNPQLHAALKLTPQQEQGWKRIAAERAQWLNTVRSGQARIRATLVAELKKPQPDLAHIDAVENEESARMQAAHRNLQQAQLALYQELSPQQKTTVRDAFLRRLQAIRAQAIAARRRALAQQK